MALQNLFLPKKSLCIFLTILHFSTFVNNSHSTRENPRNCVPRKCGTNSLSIEFPFWIPGLQEPYCGSPGFNITCNDDNPIITIHSVDYIVEDIFYMNSSVLLARADVFASDKKCHVPQHNFSVKGSPFSYGLMTTDLFFFYNCTMENERETYAVDCASNATHRAFAVFHVELLEHWNYSVKSCEGPVNVPILTDRLKTLLEMNYTDILKKGFVLQWDVGYCRTCYRNGGGLNLGRKIAIGIGAAALSAIVMSLIFFFCHKRHKKCCASSYMMSEDISSDSSSKTDIEKAGNYFGVQVFDYNELEEATNHFSPNEELGDGGFGTVYKGKLRDGRVVAIKRMYESNYKRVEQFMNEVEILKQLRHRNLVNLYGCTSHHSKELLIVYEYIANGTLADHLHGARASPGSLSWTTRLNIAIDTASALTYLHVSDVIHRDVKTSNILLDNNFCVKVADFGLSRLLPTDVTHISTAPQGTPGYVDPEYHECYHLTDKSDVYSFGVVLMELISSKLAVDITRHRQEINLSTMAINKIQSNALHQLVDPNLGYESDYKVRTTINDVAELAFRCLQSGRDMRPSMQDVVNVLDTIRSQNHCVDKMDTHDADDNVELLKNSSLVLSPNTVTAEWISTRTTPNTSS